uniref:C-type lectin domain-containing protein n=1 Tax=Salmo trutta TaxID=8032 RepID=A0A674EKD7_SALTR
MLPQGAHHNLNSQVLRVHGGDPLLLLQPVWGCSCPEGWLKFYCSCYYITTEQKSWNESRHDCLARKADLVIKNSQEEQVFLTTFDQCIWIGLTDGETEGIWKWVDGTALTTAYWWWSEPDSEVGEEDCAMMYGGVQHIPLNAWNDWV